MAKKKFYVDEARRVVKSEFAEDPRIPFWIKNKLHHNNIKSLDEFVDNMVIKSSNPLFKSVANCDYHDEFDEYTGRQIASRYSDYKRNKYTVKQVNRMIDELQYALDVLTDYRYEVSKDQNRIVNELEEYKN